MPIDSQRLLKTQNPALIKEWHPTLNFEIDLNTIYASSGRKAWWKCGKCSYQWEATIASRNSGNGCPNCAGKVANETNSLLLLHPHIAAEYHPTKNKRPIEEILHYATTSFWWQCSKNCEHEWKTSVANRVKQGDGCPYCGGRFPTKENNLAVIHPKVAEEFDIEANAPLTPYDFTPGSSKKIQWKCKKGHTWVVPPSSRVRNGVYQNCPYCVGKKATHDNNLGATHPKLLKEYHPTLNTTPVENIRYGSSTKRWWQCSTNPEHVWEAITSSRTRKGRESGCPQCSPTPRTSKIEIEIKEKLRTQKILSNIPTTYNAFIPVSGTKNEAVDIYGTYNEHKIVIEYDSWWWHSGKGSKTPYSEKEERDTRKSLQLLEADYVVIRVREKREETYLPLLKIKNKNFIQIQWNQNEGLECLVNKITYQLKKL